MKKYRNFLFLALILAIFIGAFYGFSGIYTLSNSRQKTVVLGKENFTSSIESTYNNELQVKNMEKVDTAYTAMYFNVLNNNNLIFRRRDNSYKNVNEELCTLDLNSNSIYTIYKGIINSFDVSNDGKKVIYSYISDNGNVKTNLYDVVEKKSAKTFEYSSKDILFLNNDKYINMFNHQITIQNLANGEKQDIKTDNSLVQVDGRNVQIIKRYNYKVSPDESKVYFISNYNQKDASNVVCMTNIKNTNQVQYLVRGNIIEFEPFNNGNLLISGIINEKEGIYIYNIKNNIYKNIVEGYVDKISMTSSGKIAYIVQDSSGINEVHVGIVKNDKLYFDKIIYTNIKYISDLKWSQDSKTLFCVSNSLLSGSGSTIYKFTFYGS